MANYESLGISLYPLLDPDTGQNVCPGLIINFDTTAILLEEDAGAICVTREGHDFLRAHQLNASTTHAAHQRRSIGHIVVPTADGTVLLHMFVVHDDKFSTCQNCQV